MNHPITLISLRAASLVMLALVMAAVHAPAFPHESQTPTYTCSIDSVRSPERCAFRAELDRVKAIQRQHEQRILAIKGVQGIGIGRAQNESRAVFVVLVDQSWPPPLVPNRIEDVEVRLEQRAPVRLLHGGPGCAPCHRDQFPAPVLMGNSGGLQANSGACTLGFKACDLSSARMVFVTNSHCNVITPAPVCGLITAGGSFDEWVHPGLFEQMGSPYQIGNVAGHAAPTCPGNNNLTDATKVTSPSTLTSLGIRDVPFYPSITPGDPLPGDPVQKSGRTTGYTVGMVTAINVTVAVPADGGFCCGPLTMKQQVEWQPEEPSAPGDSGSSLCPPKRRRA